MAKQSKFSVNKKYDEITEAFREFIISQEGTYQGYFQEYLTNAMLYFMQQDIPVKKDLNDIMAQRLKNKLKAYENENKKLIQGIIKVKNLCNALTWQEKRVLPRTFEDIAEELEKLIK